MSKGIEQLLLMDANDPEVVESEKQKSALNERQGRYDVGQYGAKGVLTVV